MSGRIRSTVLSLAAVIVLTLIDQWTKWLAVVNLKGNPPIELIPGVFELSYTENRGAAFGLLQDRRWFFLVVTMIVLAGVLALFYRMPFTRRYTPLRFMLVIFAAGAVGNLIDRIFRGYVVDFFYIRLIDFPLFNVADCYVTWTIVLFALLILFKYKEEDLHFIPGMSDRKGKEHE